MDNSTAKELAHHRFGEEHFHQWFHDCTEALGHVRDFRGHKKGVEAFVFLNRKRNFSTVSANAKLRYTTFCVRCM